MLLGILLLLNHLLPLHHLDLIHLFAFHGERKLTFDQLLLGHFDPSELFFAYRRVLHLLLLLLDLLLDSMELSLLEADFFHVRELAQLTRPRQISQLLFLSFYIFLQVDQLAVLLLICLQLPFTFLNLALHLPFSRIHLVNVLLFSLANLLSPLRVPPIQLLQEDLLSVH